MIKLIVTVRDGVVQAVSANHPESVDVVIYDRDDDDIGAIVVDEFEAEDEFNFNLLLSGIAANE